MQQKTMRVMKGLGVCLALNLAINSSIFTSNTRAGEADVVGVKIIKEGTGSYRFDVSVRHGDTGWSHFANKWDVVAPDGTILGTRELAHPHESEQPFTRSLGGVVIPESLTSVTIRAHDSVDKYGGAEIRVNVPR